MSVASIETAIAAEFQVLKTDLVTFAMKVKSGVQIGIADAEAALAALVTNAGGLASDLQKIETWVAEFLPVAQAAGVSSSDLAIVNSGLADAKNVVAGLTAVQASAAAGASDVGALVGGIAAYQSAAGSVNSLVAAIGNVVTPAAAQVVSPPTPNQG